jgi:hypothetical protein
MEPSKAEMLGDSFLAAMEAYSTMRVNLLTFNDIIVESGAGKGFDSRVVDALAVLDLLFAPAEHFTDGEYTPPK